MRVLISLREFLKTGVFGPLHLEMNLLDVAKVLGAPSHFITGHAENIPTYWCYGKLEIEFEEIAPHRIRFYQLEFANDLEGQFEPISRDSILSLDGFSGKTNPSDFLQSNLCDLGQVVVNISALADDILLNVCMGRVEIYFRVESSFTIDGNALDFIKNNSLEDFLLTVDQQSTVDSIYVMSPSHSSTSSYMSVYRLSGTEYLNLIAKDA